MLLLLLLPLLLLLLCFFAAAFALALASAFAIANRQLEALQVLLQVASFACSKEPVPVHSFCDLLWATRG